MKRFLFIVLSLLLLSLVLYLNDEKDVLTKVRLAENSSMDDVTIVQKKEGSVKWTLNAKKAVFLNRDQVRLSGVTVTLPDKGLTLATDEGTYNLESKDLEIAGTVTASTSDYDIVARSLRWDAATNELSSDQKVSIKGKKFLVEGESLVSTADRAKLSNNVKAVFYE